MSPLENPVRNPGYANPWPTDSSAFVDPAAASDSSWPDPVWPPAITDPPPPVEDDLLADNESESDMLDNDGRATGFGHYAPESADQEASVESAEEPEQQSRPFAPTSTLDVPLHDSAESGETPTQDGEDQHVWRMQEAPHMNPVAPLPELQRLDQRPQSLPDTGGQVAPQYYGMSPQSASQVPPRFDPNIASVPAQFDPYAPQNYAPYGAGYPQSVPPSNPQVPPAGAQFDPYSASTPPRVLPGEVGLTAADRTPQGPPAPGQPGHGIAQRPQDFGLAFQPHQLGVSDVDPRTGGQWMGQPPAPAAQYLAEQGHTLNQAAASRLPGAPVSGGGYPVPDAAAARPTNPYTPPSPRPFGGGVSVPGGGVGSNLRQEAFTGETKPKPRSGWRKAVLRSTFGAINPGESTPEREEREWTEHIQANMPQDHLVYVTISPRGGVAKTTTTVGTASTFSMNRSAEVVAVDINPAAGNLSDRVTEEATASFVDLLNDRGAYGHLNRIRKYTKQNYVSKLDVLASPRREGAAPPRYTPESLAQTVEVLKTGYRIISLDPGNDLDSPILQAILDLVQAVVVVTDVGVGGARAAATVYNWLSYYHPALLNRSFLVMSDKHPKFNAANKQKIEETFVNTPWKDPLYIPYDEHLNEGTEVDMDKLQKPTRRAYLEVTHRLTQWYGHPPIPRKPSA